MLHLRLREFMLALFVALATPTTGAPADFQAGALKISQPWSRATPKGAQVGAGYLTITNTGSEPDRLIGGSLADAGRVEIHEDTIEGGVEDAPGPRRPRDQAGRDPSRSSPVAITRCSWT